MSSAAQPDGLGVIALVSGGKDSFFSLMHCRANGHRIVALANLHPALPQKHGPSDDTSQPPVATISAASAAVSAPGLESTPGGGLRQGLDQDLSHAAILPDHEGGVSGNEVVPGLDEDEHDLNSFMYQTVGHQVIPLYAEATGIPLYRRVITGGPTQHGKEYSHYPRSTANPNASAGRDARGDTGDTVPVNEDSDETESMIPLLQAIKKAHPEANAICAGAILSTYQRTRVESVATRLGLTPLAYLWKFPVLPTPGPLDPIAGSDAQLLDDMAAAGVEARIIKVASGGLDDAFLWTNVASAAGKGRLAKAMRRFGAAETGAVIGEGGEFETLVLDGPSSLFRKRIVVPEEDRRVVREGGGSAFLSLRNARLEDKGDNERSGGDVRIPDLLDSKFVGVLGALSSPGIDESSLGLESSLNAGDESSPQLGDLQPSKKLQQWSFVGAKSASVEAETRSIVEQIRERLRQHYLPSAAILSATVVLRRMADFPAVNSIYGTLFDAPNPPSRVTISCGDALSSAAGANIAVYLTVHTALQPNQRQGLHVQSRSYWAPANIGPYSQAISIPVASLGSEAEEDAEASSRLRLVSIAGQIPLIPATMALPPGSSSSSEEDPLPLQLTLSLQHLWRIGIETGVQWWTSAVAYFPAACSSPPPPGEGQKKKSQNQMARKARLAAKAWRMAHHHHLSTDDEEEEGEEDETGPDLWDRKYNPLYMTFASGGGGDDGEVARRVLPDRSVLASASASAGVVPPLFVAEVDELPRGAGVEWHAHLGVALAGERGVVLREVCLPVSGAGGGGDGREEVVVVSQVIVGSCGGDGKGLRFVQTVVAEGFGGGGGGGGGDRHGQVAKMALGQLGEVGATAGELAAVVRYVDAGVLRGGSMKGGEGGVVPCRSLWDGRGERLAAVTVYQSVFH
ncbi:hypothetical protein C8A00DRAFT_17937 [Chaetomidium leptoderma]|uniref:Diphthine--ammonia ligase n=1 Tax=Chaetomidium leptoderma TaxID=669021 RepID=A0AAN6ZUB9_9PEZI|nr:hypothetical protein C8A00DRAFT_17937 [Chaetomidium leptoderma]